jgi:hypothetical protein
MVKFKEWLLTKDAGFVHESLQIETNRIFWDFCLHETNPRNESFKNKSTIQIFKVWIRESETSGFVRIQIRKYLFLRIRFVL